MKLKKYKDIPTYWDGTADRTLESLKKIARNRKQKGARYTQIQCINAWKKGLRYIDNNTINVLKTDLWTEGVDRRREILNHLLSEIKGRRVNAYGMDISRDVCLQAKNNGTEGNIVQGDIRSLPFRENFFDLILDLSTLDHLPLHQVPCVIRGYKRCLKREGVLVLMFAPSGGLFELFGHYHVYGGLKLILTGKYKEERLSRDFYTFPTSSVKVYLKNNGFKILEEYAVHFLNIILPPLIDLLSPSRIYKLFQDIEYSKISKYLKFFAPMYIFIAKNKTEKMSVNDQRNFWSLRAKISGNSLSSVLWLDRPVWNKYIDALQMHHLKSIIAQIKKTDTVLDIGCGIGRLTFRLANICKEVYGVDISEESVEICNRKSKKIHNAKFRVMDARNLKFKDETFDWVFSITCIECIANREDFASAIKELLRVTKTNGNVVLLEHITNKIDAENLICLSKNELFKIIRDAEGEIVLWRGVDIPILRKMLDLCFGLTTRFVTRKNYRARGDLSENHIRLSEYLSKQGKINKIIEKSLMLILTQLIKPFEYSIPRVWRTQSEYVLVEFKRENKKEEM